MAKTPRGKKTAGERGAKKRRRAPSALAVVVFLLLAGAAVLAAWLTYSYDPPPQVADAGNTDTAVKIDLSKDSGGQQAAEKAAASPGKPATAERAPVQGQGIGKPDAPASPPAKPGTPAPQQTAQPPAAQQPAVQQPAPQASQPVEPKQQPTSSAGDSGTQAPAAAPPQQQASLPLSTGGAFTPSGGLRPAPDPALVTPSDNGPLPVVAPDGRTPLQVYARPYDATGRPRIAIVVGSLGLSQATTLAAIQQLPGGVTLAFAPYGRNLQDYVNQARAAGHEVLLQVPMEPMDYPTNDPGPHTLLTSLTIHRNLQRLDWLLGRFTGYVGVVNFMGGRFTSAESHLMPILEAMKKRGLMFLDARATSSSVAPDLAGKIKLAVAANDRVVDAIASRAAIDARLLELERLANASGGAIGIGFPYPVTIERLAQWTRAMGDRGFDLVPVSALVKQ